MQRILISVTNDLVTDQRVAKICAVLTEMSYEILLIGRKLPSSLPISRSYKTVRMQLLFNKGFLFYAEYNLRLFFKLLFTRKDILLANDLDTLLPNFLVSKILNKKLVYDSHELFTEIPELTSRPKVKAVWKYIEKKIFPKLKNVYTVNRTIAEIYKNKYNVDVKVIRNIAAEYKRKNLKQGLSNNIKGDKKMLILQGSGINIDRGAEEAVEMMQHLDNTILYIIGSGDVFEELKKLVVQLKLIDKVFIKDKMSYDELMTYTQVADFGLSLDKGTNLNYEYALPNKVFDYIQTETPIIASNRKVVANLVKENDIGFVLKSEVPKIMAKEISATINNQDLIEKYELNLKKASKRYTWEKESIKLKNIFNNLN